MATVKFDYAKVHLEAIISGLKPGEQLSIVQNGEPLATLARNNPNQFRRKRRLWRYSLRTLLVLITALCIWLGYLVPKAHQQRRLINALQSVGGEMRFDYEYDYSVNRRLRGPHTDPPGPDWLREMIGIEYFATVVDASLSATDVSETLKEIQRVASIEYLFIRGSTIEADDMRIIRSLPNLRWFTLSECQIRDEHVALLDGHPRLEQLCLPADRQWDAALARLQKLPELNHLQLYGCTGAALVNLRRFPKLKQLSLAGPHFGDGSIERIVQLPSLQRLELTGTFVTDTGLRRLTAAPNLREVFIMLNRGAISKTAINDVRGQIPQVDVLDR